MKLDHIREKMESGQLCFGTHCSTTEPWYYEMCGFLGYDYVWIDNEHAGMTMPMVQNAIVATNAGGCAALQKRPPRGLLAGLWEFPACAGHVSPEQAMQQARQWGLTPLSAEPLPAYRHIFTHREWDMHGFLVIAEGSGGPFEWVDWDRLRRDMALPSALQGFERAAFQILSREKRSNHP